jgi:hypothetical protein
VHHHRGGGRSTVKGRRSSLIRSPSQAGSRSTRQGSTTRSPGIDGRKGAARGRDHRNGVPDNARDSARPAVDHARVAFLEQRLKGQSIRRLKTATASPDTTPGLSWTTSNGRRVHQRWACSSRLRRAAWHQDHAASRAASRLRPPHPASARPPTPQGHRKRRQPQVVGAEGDALVEADERCWFACVDLTCARERQTVEGHNGCEGHQANRPGTASPGPQHRTPSPQAN